jgi:hypothetical protein
MPVASYRSTFGVNKDVTPVTLTSAITAGATSIPVSGTTVPANSTITFVDGPLTEVRAVSAGGGTNTLTVAATTNAHSAGCYITWQLTASLGPTDFIPVTVLNVQDNIMQLKDKGFRGSAVLEYANVQGTRFAAVTVGGDVINDTFPYFIGGIMGAADFAGGSPNTHSFSVKNTSDTQPTALAFMDFNAIDTRIYAGAKVEEVAVTFDPAGLLTYQAKFQSWMSGPVGATTQTYATTTPAQAWACQATIGGTNVSTVLKSVITIKRPAQPIFTLQNLQDPYRMWLGPISVEGSMDLVFEDNSQLNNFLNNSQPSLTLLFTPPGGTNTIQFTMTKCNFETFVPNQLATEGYVKATVAFRALGNTTDATTAGTGYSPIKVTVKNSKVTGYYV